MAAGCRGGGEIVTVMADGNVDYSKLNPITATLSQMDLYLLSKNENKIGQDAINKRQTILNRDRFEKSQLLPCNLVISTINGRIFGLTNRLRLVNITY